MTLRTSIVSPPRSKAGHKAIVRKQWSAPRLRRLGTAAAHTKRIDKRGRNDGGYGNKRRT